VFTLPRMNRPDNRAPDQLRTISFHPNVAKNATGSVLVCFGETRVICSATIEEGVPGWMRAQRVTGGWLTAEYSMLPYSTHERKSRDISRGKLDGRSSEIQRLIGRSMRAVVDLQKIGQRTLWIDCDVLQADGGTRTASVTGACVATAIAFNRLMAEGKIKDFPLKKLVAAVSAGVYEGTPVLDLNYPEDKAATVDFNIVMTEALEFVEVQGSGEEAVFTSEQMNAMLELSKNGIAEIFSLQKMAILSADKAEPVDFASLVTSFGKKSLLALPFVLGLLCAGSRSNAEDLPNPQLLPTTKAIHGKITATAAPSADAMKPYTETVPLADGATFDLIPIPAGSFKIGSPETEKDRKADESPQKDVTIAPFWMAKVETTWNLYRPYMENGKARNKDGTLNRDTDMTTSEAPEIKDGETLIDTVSQPTPPYIPMHFSMGDGYSKDYPAVGITYHAANKYCEWLSAQTGHFYRLPTEAEWEYACRAGTTTAYSFGDDAAQLGEYAWFADNSEFQYQKVGTKKPNPWGLYDMHGNAAELTLDSYLPEAYGKLADNAKNPWNPPVTRYPTVIRGGHWDTDANALRSAARAQTSAELKSLDPQIPKSLWYFTNASWLGFRIVRPLETPSVEEMHKAWNQGPGDSE
jgi:ribonuclease PH